MAEFTQVASNVGREAAQKARAFVASNDTAKKAKDALYTLVGLGVLGAQKVTIAAKAVQQKVDASVDTDGLKAAMERNADEIATTVKRQAAKADAKVNEALAIAEALVAPYEEKLPAPAREVTAKVRAVASSARGKVTDALRSNDVAADAVATDVPADESTPAQ
jgi:hypothetical protein